MAIHHIRNSKTLLCFLLASISLSVITFMHVPSAGDLTDHRYFDGQEKGSANTSFDLPINIVNNNSKDTVITIPGDISCASDQKLCDKIKFAGNFSDADKRKYQALIIKQIKSIDAILSTNSTIRDTLYSISLDTGKGTRRGRAGKSTISINLGNISSQAEFLEILTHELGHIVDLGILQGNSHYIQKAFSNIDHTFFSVDDISLEYYGISRINNTTRKQTASALDFVGGYAMNDPFEDFAESFNMYLNHRNVFALLGTEDKLLKQKYNFMERLFLKKYLKADTTTASSMKNDLSQRAWDTTKGY